MTNNDNNRLTRIEQLKIAAFDIANNIIRTPKAQWAAENPEYTKEAEVKRVLRETYLTIKELE